MAEEILVAVPSDNPGGLDAAPSGHFGHCDCYTIAKITDGAIAEVLVQPNQGHEHGNCLQPVQELAAHGVKALLAGGMGMRPLMGMQAMGIRPYYHQGHGTVRECLQAYVDGKLPMFGQENTCHGGGHCGGH